MEKSKKYKFTNKAQYGNLYFCTNEIYIVNYIENFIRSKEGWIKSVLKKVEDVKEKQKGFEYKTGEIHKFLGKEYY